MSLFPAYGADEECPPAVSVDDKSECRATATAQWLENNSFAAGEEQIKQATGALPVVVSTGESDTTNSTDDDDSSSSSAENSSAGGKKSQNRKAKKAKKHTKRKHKNEEKAASPPGPILEFHNEDYYVDKEPARSYKSVDTLHRPACPRYRAHFHRKLGAHICQIAAFADDRRRDGVKRKRLKRYYRPSRRRQLLMASELRRHHLTPFDENEYTLQMGRLNRRTMEAPNELEAWLGLIELQERNPYKWSRLLLAEKKLDYVQRALVYHPRAEAIYRVYIDTINATYPSYEISKMLDRLLARDPHSYTLWTAQIMTTQGSMARCVVPDVLRIYERAMQKLHHSVSHKATTNPSAGGGAAAASDQMADRVMLNLFHNCALFLRQSGLYEQFVALIKLALELNVSAEQFGSAMTARSGEEQRNLIEYEELVLQSGLPMNELWLRIERLRQGYNFLPCPPGAACSDPQRIVFNEDVCHYIYPLRQRGNSFELMLLVLRLLKLPFVQCDALARRLGARLDDIGDSDAVEDILAVAVRRTFLLSSAQQAQHEEFLGGLYELAKEMAVSPTFLSNTLGHELYGEFLRALLLNCAATEAVSGGEERKRLAFLLLWCRFERLLLVLQRCGGGRAAPEFVKAGRGRFKALLRQPANRNALHLYVEFALYEWEALTAEAPLEAVCHTFENIIVAHRTQAGVAAAATPAVAEEAMLGVLPEDSVMAEASLPASAADFCYAHLMYAEVLLARSRQEEAAHVLVAYALALDVRRPATAAKQSEMPAVSAARKLAALQRVTQRLDGLIAVERNVTIMLLEQYLLPDFVITLLRMRTLLHCLMGQKLEALSYLERLLRHFHRGDNDRHDFLRENVQELYAVVLQLPCAACAVTPSLVATSLCTAVGEYPRNLLLLQRCATLSNAPWYKIRAVLLQRTHSNILGVTFLIAAARYRFLQTLRANSAGGGEKTALPPGLACDAKHDEAIVRNRILSLFRYLTTDNGQWQPTGCTKALQRNPLFWRFYLRCLTNATTPFETSQRCLLTALDECPWSKALYMDGAMFVPQELPRLQDLLIEKQMRVYALPEELEILREK